MNIMQVYLDSPWHLKSNQWRNQTINVMYINSGMLCSTIVVWILFLFFSWLKFHVDTCVYMNSEAPSTLLMLITKKKKIAANSLNGFSLTPVVYPAEPQYVTFAAPRCQRYHNHSDYSCAKCVDFSIVMTDYFWRNLF